MRGEVRTPGGEILTLPELISWRLIHTDGRSADSFEITFPTQKDLLLPLCRGAGFHASENGSVVFCGVVDEVEAVWADAFTTTLCGRGLAARLMDNQAEAAQYYNLDMDTVLDRYVRPWGVDRIRVEGGPWRAQLVSVGAGCSCRKVLEGFCRISGAPAPWFSPDGTLQIARGAGRHTLGDEDVLSAKWRLCRYGVITEQRVHDLTTGAVTTAVDPVLQTYDVDCRRIATRSGPFTHITERTARQRIEEAARDLIVLELTLPGSHPARCRDLVQVRLSALGVDEEFAVTETCRRFDGSGETTQLWLQPKER